jgi:GGDEF domain-containing protein
VCEAVAAFEFHWRGELFKVGTHTGVAAFEGGFGDLTEIVRHADAACHRAKHAGPGNVKVHEDVLLRGADDAAVPA